MVEALNKKRFLEELGYLNKVFIDHFLEIFDNCKHYRD